MALTSDASRGCITSRDSWLRAAHANANANAHPEYVGITYLEFELTDAATRHPELARLAGTGRLFALSDNKNIGGHGGGHLHLGVALRVPEDWIRSCGVDWTDPVAARAALLVEFADWSVGLQDLIRPCSATPPVANGVGRYGLNLATSERATAELGDR